MTSTEMAMATFVGTGYDFLDVPPMSCFDGLPPSRHPQSIYPDGKSVVVTC